MDVVFPRKSAVASALVTLGLIGGLFIGMWESIQLLQRIQTVDIPLLEMTAINLKLQDHVQGKLEILVQSDDRGYSELFDAERSVLKEQLRDYKVLLKNATSAIKNWDQLFDRSELNQQENEIINLVYQGKKLEAHLRLESAAFTKVSDSFRRPFQDIAEKLAERRDQEIASRLHWMFMLAGGAVGTFVLIALMWMNVYGAYRANLERRRKAEEELEQQRAKAIESAKMVTLGEMAGGIAHEINNPLAIILIIIDTIKESLKAPSINSELVNSNLGKLINMTNRIAKIIRGLRSFSRDGTTDPFLKNQLSVIFEDTFELIRGRCKDNGVKLRLHPEQYRHELDCRAVQISQVIANLVGNSVDAIKNLSERWIDVSVDKESENLIIRITDSGAGVAEAVAERIFNPFFTTKKVGEGTGLGLAISKSIIESHSGRFYINQDCVNTQFVIELPINQALTESRDMIGAGHRKSAQSA